MLTEKITLEGKIKLTYTERMQKYKLYNYCYMIVHDINSLFNYKIMSHKLYKRPDVLERFVTKIEEKFLAIQKDLFAPVKMILASGNLKAYNEATEC